METQGQDQKDRAAATWLRLQVAAEAHGALKEAAKNEGRGVADFAGRLLEEAAAGNYGFGEPASADVPGDEGVYSLQKPSQQPLSVYASEARHLILFGTTLRSILPFQTFLERKAEAGARLTFVLVAEDLLVSQPSVLEQVALRHGRMSLDVLEQLRTTSTLLEDLHAAHPKNISVVRLGILPTFGLTIVDPFEPSAKMRIALYLYQHPSDCNLALHIQPSNAESRAAFEAFMAHHLRLVTDSSSQMPAVRELAGARTAD